MKIRLDEGRSVLGNKVEAAAPLQGSMITEAELRMVEAGISEPVSSIPPQAPAPEEPEAPELEQEQPLMLTGPSSEEERNALDDFAGTLADEETARLRKRRGETEEACGVMAASKPTTVKVSGFTEKTFVGFGSN